MKKLLPFLAVFLIHGSMLAGVPAALIFWTPAWPAGMEAAFFRWVGGALAGGSFLLYVRTVGGLTLPSKGSPAIWDPPQKLAREGLYRIVRNPMYAAVVGIAAGEAIFWNRAWLVLYAAGLWAGFDLFVRLYEEPVLRRTFGTAYDDYCRRVPRWMPSIFSKDRFSSDLRSSS